MTIFADISNAFDPTLGNVATGIVSSAISTNAGVLTTMLTLYVAVKGGLAATRNLSMAGFWESVFIAVSVAVLMSATFYSQYIVQSALTTIPQWLAGAINGSGGNLNTASQFDQLWFATKALELSVDKLANGWSPSDIASRIEAGMIAFGALIILIIAFFLYEMAQWLMTLLVCLGPFLIWLALFKMTREVPMRWGGKIIGVLVVYLIIDIAMQICLKADFAFVQQAAAAGGNIDQQIQELMECAAYDFFIIGVLIISSAIGAYIGGGVASSGLLAAFMWRTVTRMLAQIGKTVAGIAGGA